MVSRRDYLASVQQVMLNSSRAAVLTEDGRLIIHPIEVAASEGSNPDEFDVTLPPPGAPQVSLPKCEGLSERLISRHMHVIRCSIRCRMMQHESSSTSMVMSDHVIGWHTIIFL